MTLDQLRIFIAVAEREHITRAAEALHLTQSAVSAAIAALENRHAVTLFDRVGRAIILNDTGRAFLPEAKAVLDRAAAAEMALDDLSGLLRGRLSIMASQTIASYWLPQYLVAYHAAYPHIEIDVRFANTDQVADAVDSGEAELGVVEGLVDRPALALTVLAEDEMVIVVSPDHPWAQGAGRGALEDVAWIVRETGSGTRAAFDRMVEGLEVEIVMALPGNEAVLGAVEAGLGAALMSRIVATARVAAGRLRIIEGRPHKRRFYLLRHRERYGTKAAEAFVALLAARDQSK